MTPRIERALVRAFLSFVLGAVACKEPPAAPVRLYEEHFESTCASASLCGFERVAGEESDLSYVTTFHDADHALRFRGGAIARGPGASSARAAVLGFGSLSGRASVRCDPGNVLHVAITLERVDDGAPPTFLDVLEGRLRGASEWGPASNLVLTARSALRDGGLGASFLSANVRVGSIVISHEGPGACELSDLVIDDTGSILVPTPGGGCE